MSKVLVITTSLRAKSNTDILAGRLIAGARDAGHAVERISLKGKEIKFCVGCLACQKTQKCVLKDDAEAIAEQVKNADTLVFVTPHLLLRDERPDEDPAGRRPGDAGAGRQRPAGLDRLLPEGGAGRHALLRRN